MGSSGYLSIDLGLRGAAVGLSLLLAGVALRDRRDSTVARLAAGSRSAPPLPRSARRRLFRGRGHGGACFCWRCSSGGPVVFWLWARAAFDDDFVLRRWHGALWAALVGIELLVAGGIVQWPVPGLALDRAVQAASLGLALLAAAQTLATWRADLVQGRRRLRLAVLIGTSAYIAIMAFLREFFSAGAATGFPRVDGECRQRFRPLRAGKPRCMEISCRRPERRKAPELSRRQPASSAKHPSRCRKRRTSPSSIRPCCAGWSI